MRDGFRLRVPPGYASPIYLYEIDRAKLAVKVATRVKNKLRAAKIMLSIGLLLVCFAYFDKGNIIGGGEVGLFIIGLLLVMAGAYALGSEKLSN